MNAKLSAAIDRLAGLYEYGHLRADTSPDEFLEQVADEITSLREENEQLRAKVLVWHKWPEEKPIDKGETYLCWNEYDGLWWDDWILLKNGEYFWDLDFVDGPVTHWAEIPRPNDRNPAIPPDR